MTGHWTEMVMWQTMLGWERGDGNVRFNLMPRLLHTRYRGKPVDCRVQSGDIPLLNRASRPVSRPGKRGVSPHLSTQTPLPAIRPEQVLWQLVSNMASALVNVTKNNAEHLGRIRSNDFPGTVSAAFARRS